MKALELEIRKMLPKIRIHKGVQAVVSKQISQKFSNHLIAMMMKMTLIDKC